MQLDLHSCNNTNENFDEDITPKWVRRKNMAQEPQMNSKLIQRRYFEDDFPKFCFNISFGNIYLTT